MANFGHFEGERSQVKAFGTWALLQIAGPLKTRILHAAGSGHDSRLQTSTQLLTQRFGDDGLWNHATGSIDVRHTMWLTGNLGSLDVGVWEKLRSTLAGRATSCKYNEVQACMHKTTVLIASACLCGTGLLRSAVMLRHVEG